MQDINQGKGDHGLPYIDSELDSAFEEEHLLASPHLVQRLGIRAEFTWGSGVTGPVSRTNTC